MRWLLSILISVLLGALAGWLAGRIMKRDGSFLRNLILGICGSVVGGIVAGALHIGGDSLLAQMLISIGGACLILFIVGLFTKQ